MSRRKLGDRSIRKITKTGGGTFYTTIPIEIMRELKWRERQKIVVKRVGKRIVIEDWK